MLVVSIVGVYRRVGLGVVAARVEVREAVDPLVVGLDLSTN